MHVLGLTVVLLAFCSVGISGLKNITITAESDFRTVFNQFESKSDAKFVYFDYVIVESIAEDSFSDYKNLQLIYFDKNGITDIPENLFQFNTEIRFVTIKNNLLTTLPPNIFAAMKKVMMITLTGNRLENIDENLFRNNPKMITLILQSNSITTIHPRAFENLVELKVLRLLNNQISSLPDNIFVNNKNLVDLYLNNNNLKVLSSSALFANNPVLKFLNLGENLLHRFDFNILKSNNQIEELVMGRNELFELVNYEQTPQLLPNLKNVVILSNYFNCSYYAKVNSHFASNNVSLDAVYDPTTVIRAYETEETANCIPDEGYGKVLAEKLNKSYNKLYVPEDTIEVTKQSLYTLDPQSHVPGMVTFSFISLLQDVNNCMNGVEGYKSIILGSCDKY